jgi:hypothetical protein
MRILRGLSSRFLTCGCLVGVYETYDSEIVNILDARSASCREPEHQNGNLGPAVDRASALEVTADHGVER